MEMKTRTKIILAFITMLVAMCLFNIGAVNAATEVTSGDNKVSTKNEIMDNLVGKIDEITGINGHSKRYDLELDTLNLLNLLLDTSKLDSLVKSDNYIYQNVYLKLDEDITRVVMGYGCYIDSNDIKEEAKIVTINNIRYAEIPIAVIQKVNGIYNPDIIGKSGRLGFVGSNNYACINLMKDTEILDNIAICSMPSEVEYCKTNGAYIYLTSDTNEDFMIGGLGTGTSADNLYNRSKANGNCYINVELPIKIGETLELAPFGTLNYKGEIQGDYYKYHYQAKVTDKTLFNKDTIICRIALKDYKVLNMSVLHFQGNLVTNEDIKLNDTTTGIKIETTTNVISSNVVLTSTTVTDQNVLNTVKGALKEISTKYMVYDINLLENNVKVQPNGKIKVSIPIPSDYNKEKLEVYRIEDNGNRIKYDVKVDGDYATFETDHFSTYVLAENTTQAGATSKGNEKDDTPKTGTIGNINPLVYMTIISALGIIVFRKK